MLFIYINNIKNVRTWQIKLLYEYLTGKDEKNTKKYYSDDDTSQDMYPRYWGLSMYTTSKFTCNPSSFKNNDSRQFLDANFNMMWG